MKETYKCPNCGEELDAMNVEQYPVFPTPHFYCKQCNHSWEIWHRGEGNAWINPLKKVIEK